MPRPRKTGRNAQTVMTAPVEVKISPVQAPALEVLEQPLPAAGELGFDFSFAFQPIVDVRCRQVVSYEALVRGPHGEPSETILSRLSPADVFLFEEQSHARAIALANRLRVPCRLNLNLAASGIHALAPSVVGIYQSCLQHNLPTRNIILELVESQDLVDQGHLLHSLRRIQEMGFSIAFDDFGAGYSGLKLLAEYQPHYIKVDRHLIGDIQQDVVRQRIFTGIWRICNSLAIHIVAEGVEQAGEYLWLQGMGVRYFQGNYFAQPAFETLPEIPGAVYYGP